MIWIRNGRIMDPESGLDQIGDVLLDGDQIVKIGKVDSAEDGCQVIDAKDGS